MAAGNWDYQHELQFYDPRYLLEHPSGPMVLEQEEDPIWLGAWISQRSTGTTQWTGVNAFPDRDRWVCNHGVGNGSFEPGWAYGYALLATRNRYSGRPGFFYWDEEILLVDHLRPDADLNKNFEQEIEGLRERQAQIQGAIDRAIERFEALQNKTRK